MSYAELENRKRIDYGFHLEYRTRWSDNDMYGHLNNSIYLFLFDSIINAYLIEHCGREPTTSEQIGLVVHSQCDYFGSISYPAMIDLGLRVNKLGKSSVTYEVGVFEQGAEDVRAVGGYIHVFVDREKNRPVANGMPQEVKQGLQKLLVKEMSKF